MNRTTLLLDTPFSTSERVLRNRNQGSYLDKDITFEDFTLDLNNSDNGASQTRLLAFCSLSRVTGLTLTRVRITNGGYIGLSYGSSRIVRITDCEFSELGYVNTAPNCGPAVWGTAASGDFPEDVIIKGCTFKDNEWHGVHVGGSHVSINSCIFKDNYETHIFSSIISDGAGGFLTYTYDLDITDNSFEGLRKKDISGHGIEVNSEILNIPNNVIKDCDHGGIAVSGAIDVTVENNFICNVNKIAPDTWSGIDVISTTTNPLGGAKRVKIIGNTVIDDQVTPTTERAFLGS